MVLNGDGKTTKIKDENDSKDAKNCLTVMNAKYMNDPNEGIVIIRELTKQLDDNIIFSRKNTEDYINGIYDEKFVFLKSFTEQIDKLTMWNRYANDYGGDGKNSNGCCVLVNPACFANNSEYSQSRKTRSEEKKSDDYNLYRVVYLSSEGKIKQNDNPGLHKNVYILYDNLKKLFAELNDCLKEYSQKNLSDAEEIREHVEKTLRASLMDIMFLFKYDDYSDEHESRLILFRSKDNQEDIKLISSDIPMLALNPFFQILINGIILGPNVRNTDQWKPYFQYQLNNMWSKHSVKGAQTEGDNSQNYFIKKSDIKYLT